MISEGAVFALTAGLKIAIFLAVLVLAFLADKVVKDKKNVHGLNVMALAFILIAFSEFLHIMSHIHEGFMPWMMSHGNLHLITHPLFIIAGVGIIWYLWGINKNIEDYR